MSEARHRPSFDRGTVDEAHHFGAAIRDEALEMCAAQRRLALTATIPEAPALARVIELMGPVVCELSIADLAGQWLAEFDAVVLRLRLSPGEQARYDATVGAFREVFERFWRVSKHARWSDFVAMAARSEGGQRALAAFRDSRRLTSFPEAKRAALAELLIRHRGNVGAEQVPRRKPTRMSEGCRFQLPDAAGPIAKLAQHV